MNRRTEDDETASDVHIDVPSVITVPGEPLAGADGETSTSPLELRAPSRLISLPTSTRLELAFADTVSAKEASGELGAETTTELLAAREKGDDGDATLERRPHRDDEPTLDAPVVRPVSRREPEPPPSTTNADEPTLEKPAPLAMPAPVDLPPTRPRLDSEAAGQWSGWHAQPEAARALQGVVSPVSSGTEILPRSAVREAMALLRSPNGLAPDAPGPRATQPLPFSPLASPPSAPGTGNGPAAEPGRRGLSPFTVFVITFSITGALLVGGILLQRRATPSASSAPAPAPAVSASASSMASATPSPVDVASATPPEPAVPAAATAPMPPGSVRTKVRSGPNRHGHGGSKPVRP